MAVARQQRMTLEEFLALPEEEPPLEFADGLVSQKVSPQNIHGALQAELAWLLVQACRASGDARVFTEVRTIFGGTSLVPDISVYRTERIQVDAEGRMLKYFTVPPDIAIEIASPGQSVTELVRKCLRYISEGVHIALLIDPEDESVLAFRPNEPDAAWRDGDAMDLSSVLPAFRLVARDLFATLHIGKAGE